MINVVLYEPEIPQNTGNIMRTCVGFNCRLHLIKPLGFEIDDRKLRRSGMDYIKDLEYYIYENWQDFVDKNPASCYYFVTRYGKKPPASFDFTTCEDVYFVFGKESSGIDKEILKKSLDTCMRLPMVENARSLNLSNCVAIIVYEALRQLDFPNLSQVEQLKGADFLEK